MPVVLLIVAVDSKILFQGLVYTFCLSVAFRVVTRGKVQFHVQSLSKGSEKSRDKFGAMIRSNVGWTTMFGEHMNDK